MSAPPADLPRQLAQWLQATDITELELTSPERRLRLQRTAGDQIAVEIGAPAQAHDLHEESRHAPPCTLVRAGCVGVVLLTHPLRSDALVRVGQPVSEGQAVALLKVGKVILPVPAPRAGKVTRIVAAHHSVAGYGTPLVEIE